MQTDFSVLKDDSGPVTREQIIGAIITTLEEAYGLFCDGNDFPVGSDEWTWDVCYRYLREDIKALFPEHIMRPTPREPDAANG